MLNLEGASRFGNALDNIDKYHSKNIFRLKDVQDGYDQRVNEIRRHFNFPSDRALKLLDIGCGEGGYGLRFKAPGVNVRFIDGRLESLNYLAQFVPKEDLILHDLESNDPIPVEYSDVSLFMGILYHVGKPLHVLKKVVATADNLCIETACLDHDGVMVIYFEEDTTPATFSISGGACRPSPRWVELALQGMWLSSRQGYFLWEDEHGSRRESRWIALRLGLSENLWLATRRVFVTKNVDRFKESQDDCI